MRVYHRWFRCEHPYHPIPSESSAATSEYSMSGAEMRSGHISWVPELRRCGLILCFATFLAVVARSNLPRSSDVGLAVAGAPDNRTKLLRAEDGDHDSIQTQVRVTNDYQRTEFTATQMYPWEHVAEPARETRLEIIRWPAMQEDLEKNAVERDFIWKIEGEVIGSGATISTVFAAPGAYQCSVSSHILTDVEPRRDDVKEAEEKTFRRGDEDRIEMDAAPSASGSPEPEITMDFVVVVKYIRREIRTLTDRDRETFFNAVSIMQRVPSAIGQAVYGSKYYSKDYFNRIHISYAADFECDHWHDGAGFVTSHIAISLMYEQSLQAINPSIALPYWDFTVEGTLMDWSNFRTSSIFSDDWFGSAAPGNAMRTPDRGRFGYIPTMLDAAEYSVVHNSYGMLRSPWNNDPTPFLTRSDHLLGFRNHRKPSGCRKYRDAKKQRSWMALTNSFNDQAHGEIHELLGGAWSREATAYAERTNPIVQPFVHKMLLWVKALWRAGYFACPETCGMDVPWEDCTCRCSEATIAGKNSSEILTDAGILSGGFFYDKHAVLIESLVDEEGNAYDVLPGYTRQETKDIYDEMLQTICMPMRHGTHYGATSTNDPTFWVIHPTFDRLWHLIRLEDSEDMNESWISDNSCYGHNPEDFTPFHDLFLEGDGSVQSEPEDHAHTHVKGTKSYYTNNDLYAMLHPSKMGIPYAYDNFDWSHCDAQGVFIHGAKA
ncbi:unnamed protein product [Scytosiphon promiscuus]